MNTDNIVDLDFKDKLEALIYKYISQQNLINDLYHTINNQKKDVEYANKHHINFIDKKLFVDCIESYKELAIFLNDLYKSGIDCIECKSLCNFMDNYLKLLKYCTNDTLLDIDYFIFELNYGTEWNEDSVQDADGNPIDMSTVDKLYNYLKTKFYNKTKEEKEE